VKTNYAASDGVCKLTGEIVCTQLIYKAIAAAAFQRRYS